MTVRRGASLEASTAPAAAESIVAALVQAGTRLMFGVPGGGPNLDVVGAAEAAGIRFVLAHGETAATIMAATSADLTGAPGAGAPTPAGSATSGSTRRRWGGRWPRRRSRWPGPRWPRGRSPSRGRRRP